MKILIDQNIAYARQAFSRFGECVFADGRNFTNSQLKNFDALIIRSVTQINRTLLENTNIKFVGTATIGTDHVDIDYLKKEGITFAYAPGCNSQSVAEYVFSAITKYITSQNLRFKDLSIGIIGKGNIGSKVERMSRATGMKTLINDPPLQRKTGGKNFVSLSEALEADIVTLHVPLTFSGIDKTFHLIGNNELKKLKNKAMLINSSRGPVIDNKSLLKSIDEKQIFTVLDVWENEPRIMPELLKKVNIGTPHIAGYSLEGKVNGTKMIYDAFCQFLGIKPKWEPELPDVPGNEIEITGEPTLENSLNKIFLKIYDINRDSNELKQYCGLNEIDFARKFDELRKNYPLRRELKNYIVRLPLKNSGLAKQLKNFGVNLK